eukprot:9369731-Pyramimonas_sp.AAC.1
MHQPTPSTQPNRRHIDSANQDADGWVGCLQERGICQLVRKKSIAPNTLLHTYCTTWVASRRHHHLDGTRHSVWVCAGYHFLQATVIGVVISMSTQMEKCQTFAMRVVSVCVQ